MLLITSCTLYIDMVICISDWPAATLIGNVTASHLHTHDHYFSDWPAATLIRNVTGKLFTVIRLPFLTDGEILPVF